MHEPLRIGILYPGATVGDGATVQQAQDDYSLAPTLISPPISIRFVQTRVEEDAHREDALRRTGAPEVLLDGARELRVAHVASAIWACTSGSFVFGLEGARAQARSLADYLEVPVSSTSLAFIEACRHMGVRRVAIAASYPDEIVAMFVRFLSDAGLEVVSAQGAGIITGAEVGTIDKAATIEMVAKADRPDAEAVLVPDTAMHSIGWLDEFDAAASKPVLTANQVTLWQALALAGRHQTQPGMGSLFAV